MRARSRSYPASSYDLSTAKAEIRPEMAGSSESFTPEAKRRWDELSTRERTMLLSNAWCSRCKVVTTIVGVAGRIEDDNLILEGKCSRCGSAVGRLVEGE